MNPFGFFTDAIETALDVTTESFDWMFGQGEGPSRHNVAKLISAGLTVAAIAQGFGVAESVIEKLIEQD